MKWVKVLSIVVCLSVLIGYGGFKIYSVGYSGGETAGYKNGYSVGNEAGYSMGKQEGYGEGYISGKEDGYDEGYVSGEREGYDDGYIAGKADGYARGYDEGVEVGLGHGYTLRDPTYAEVVAFLREDKTDKNEYVEGTYGVYVCSHFARDVGNDLTPFYRPLSMRVFSLVSMNSIGLKLSSELCGLTSL